MEIEADPRHVLLGILPDEYRILYDYKTPGRKIAQVYRAGNTFYLVGPHFCERTPLVLSGFLHAILRTGETEAAGVHQLNQLFLLRRLPPEAHVFECSTLSDAVQTLEALLLAY